MKNIATGSSIGEHAQIDGHYLADVLESFDLCSIAACYYLHRVWVATISAVESGVDMLTLQGGGGIFLIALIVPIVHGISVMGNKIKPQTFLNVVIAVCFVILVAGSVYLSVALESRVTESGYIYCPSKSEEMTFSEFKTFVATPDLCPSG